MQQTLLPFDCLEVRSITTQGIKYAGSKAKLLPDILRLITPLDVHTVLDGFSGSTRVSQALAKAGYAVTSNDRSIVSSILGKCYLKTQKSKSEYASLIEHLNNLEPVNGWFTENYGGSKNNGSSQQLDGLKKPWQIHNTRKLDAIRLEIDSLNLDEQDTALALTSLILGLDKVDNTLGHFVSYLKDWSPRSYNDLVLEIPDYQIFNPNMHTVSNEDIFKVVKHQEFDLVYLDPPYGSNNEKMPPSRVRYSSYYHLWTTVCLNDKPELFGKSKRRVDTSDKVNPSVFEEYRKTKCGKYLAIQALDDLIASVNAKYVLLSYSSGGRATAEELHNVIEKNGKLINVVSLTHAKNVMSGMKWTNDWVKDADQPHKEFLFLMEKN